MRPPHPQISPSTSPAAKSPARRERGCGWAGPGRDNKANPGQEKSQAPNPAVAQDPWMQPQFLPTPRGFSLEKRLPGHDKLSIGSVICVELNTLVNCKQYVLKMMVFRQIPNLILINWMQDFDQHEKNRIFVSNQALWKQAHSRPVEELSRRTSGGKYSQCHAAAGGSGKQHHQQQQFALNQKEGGRGGTKRDFLLQKKKCCFPGTCMLKWIEMQISNLCLRRF
ncbi:uncharacterized protein [Taeniopygia guttata]|uniref:uncharacterized protein isoform X3 n=1 Tax=Taeniopygia guttata TaxID=59729 RepID=UPI003BB93950